MMAIFGCSCWQSLLTLIGHDKSLARRWPFDRSTESPLRWFSESLSLRRPFLPSLLRFQRRRSEAEYSWVKMGENLNCPCTHWSRPTSSVLVTWFRLMWLVVPGPTGGWGRRQRSLASGGFFTAASQIQSHGMRFSYIFHDSPGSFHILWFPWWCFIMFLMCWDVYWGVSWPDRPDPGWRLGSSA